MTNLKNQPATKGDLEKLEKSQQTDINRLDIKTDGLKQTIDSVEKSLRSEIRISIKESEERTDERARRYRDQILTKMDNFLSEIKDSREERITISHQFSNHESRIDNIEKDISKLKSSITPQ